MSYKKTLIIFKDDISTIVFTNIFPPRTRIGLFPKNKDQELYY